MDSESPLLAFTTCPDAESGRRIARSLVESGLAACVNMLPPMESVYRWKGNIETASEHLLIMKVSRANYGRVEQRIRELHPYELPEIVAVSIDAGLPAYLAWIVAPDRTP
ncbi:MAG TPA: divalent-cation tolerance protein CutA [Burkholderiales bacterium]